MGSRDLSKSARERLETYKNVRNFSFAEVKTVHLPEYAMMQSLK